MASRARYEADHLLRRETAGHQDPSARVCREGHVESNFALGAGYASLGGIHFDFAGVEISGLNVLSGPALAYYVSNVFGRRQFERRSAVSRRTGDAKLRLSTTYPDPRTKDWANGFDGSGVALAERSTCLACVCNGVLRGCGCGERVHP